MGMRNPQFDPADLDYSDGYFDGSSGYPRELEGGKDYQDGYEDGEGDLKIIVDKIKDTYNYENKNTYNKFKKTDT